MYQAIGITDPGLVRKGNEDGLLCCEDLAFFAVADGMGGHLAGEVASRMALQTIESFVRRSGADDDFSWPYGIDPNLSFDANRVRTSIQLANRRVFRAAESRDDFTGMGTTLTAFLGLEDGIIYGHAGDSRLYLLNNGCLKQLTRDDTWVAMVAAHNPDADPAEFANHPMRHVLTNVLGAHEKFEIQLGECKLSDGDLLLACSDGLHGQVGDDRLREIMVSGGDLKQMGDAMLKAAMDTGAPDNVTLVLVRYGGAQ